MIEGSGRPKTCESGSATLPEGAAADGAGEEGRTALLGLDLLPHILGRQLRQRVVTPACMDYKFFMTFVN
jgi:hypothetical protein